MVRHGRTAQHLPSPLRRMFSSPASQRLRWPYGEVRSFKKFSLNFFSDFTFFSSSENQSKESLKSESRLSCNAEKLPCAHLLLSGSSTCRSAPLGASSAAIRFQAHSPAEHRQLVHCLPACKVEGEWSVCALEEQILYNWKRGKIFFLFFC